MTIETPKLDNCPEPNFTLEDIEAQTELLLSIRQIKKNLNEALETYDKTKNNTKNTNTGADDKTL